MKMWVARNKYGTINLYTINPTYDESIDAWFGYDFEFIELNRLKFPEVTFENSPQQVEIKLVKEK